MKLEDRFKEHFSYIQQGLLSSVSPDLPGSLVEPIAYFLQMPSKKIRPLLALSACECVGGKLSNALPAATAVELFHDFTLIHDDIMDQDELRRGYQTLHIKYDDSTAILVGDAMIGMAYQQLIQSPPASLTEVTRIFTDALVKVCEGQALDKEFEKRASVSVDEYLDMINKKTAWLIKIACSMGSICGGASPEQVSLLALFGECLGLGFQIKDDLLDFVADESMLGKQVGSDFRMDKKTYVTMKYRETISGNPELASKYPLNIPEFDNFQDFQKALYDLKIVEATEAVIEEYTRRSLDALAQIAPLNNDNPLYFITQFLHERQY